MNEQERYMQAELMRAIWHQSHRIGLLQKQLEDALAERQRLRQHLRQLEQELKKNQVPVPAPERMDSE
jgi:hypothetical protein